MIRDFVYTFTQLLANVLLNAIALILSPFAFAVERWNRQRRTTFSSVAITGGGSGLGRGLALAYSKPGTRIVLMGRRLAKLEEVAVECREKGAEVACVKMDVTDRVALKKALLVHDDVKPIDLVIANAGVSGRTLESKDGVQQHLEQCLQPMMDINVNGVFNTVLPLSDRMRTRRRGHMVVISSLAGYLPIPEGVDYSTSKAAVRYFGLGLRGLLAPFNVGVTVVCPGYVRSEMTDCVRRDGQTMPCFMETQDAIDIMVDGIDRNVGLVDFPLPLTLVSKACASLPGPILDLLFLAYTTGSRAKTKLSGGK